MNAPSDSTWYSPDVTTFGDRLSGAREAAGLTQEQLALNLGVKLKTLRNWEEDLSEPRANKLSMLSGLLNVSLTWLLTGEGKGLDAPHDPTQGDLNADVSDLMSELRDLHGEMVRSSGRLARIERQLRAKLLAAAEE